MPRGFKRSVYRLGESSTSVVGHRSYKSWHVSDFSSPSNSLLPSYDDCGDCSFVCDFCGDLFWYVERVISLSRFGHPSYRHCCRSGSLVFPYPFPPPPVFSDLYGNVSFLQNIRAYNNMFAIHLLVVFLIKILTGEAVHMSLKFPIKYHIG